MIRDFNKSSKRKRKYVHIHFKHLEESKVALYLEDDMIIKIIMASRAAGRQGDQHCMLLSFLIFAGLRLPSRPRRKQFIPHPPLLPVKPSAVNFLVSLQIWNLRLQLGWVGPGMVWAYCSIAWIAFGWTCMQSPDETLNAKFEHEPEFKMPIRVSSFA